MQKPSVRLMGAGFVLAAVLTSAGMSAAQTVTGLTPLLQLESTGITQSKLEVFFFGRVNSRLYQTRQATLFTDRSAVSAFTSNDLDGRMPAESSQVSGRGTPAAFNRLSQVLAEARPYAGRAACSFNFRQSPPPPRPDSVLSQTVSHDYRLTWFAGGNNVLTFDLAANRPLCPGPVRNLVHQTLQYLQGVAGTAAPGSEPLVQLTVSGDTTTRFAYTGGGACPTAGCNFTQLRFVSRQIAADSDGQVRAADAFIERSSPRGPFAQTVNGPMSPGSLATLERDLAAARLDRQAGGCRIPVVHVRPAPGGYTTTITLAHSYKLTYYGGQLPARTLELPASGPDCPAALQKLVIDLLNTEQEVIATTPHMDAGS